ncbi:ABC-2 transporter permease [Lactobacillus sp. CC-MHH1034]|uniref:ABC-2 transporter permease n=1 Tax=Agrilactobacillus fermenti TaxID=2586909 RepID=UPI001E54EFCF|nr:ABC-2 transporter permease [Agrilactobacillus fermenti]MCD2255693.1 ABC-2 transporter permease [Agrilactobacillus fermenti]
MLTNLRKEFKLSLHPTVPIFWLLSALVLVPNYPYLVIFFYTTLGLFFIELNSRENNDLRYSLLLPRSKADIVKTRLFFIMIIELIQVILILPFAYLRTLWLSDLNVIPGQANLALLGLGLTLLGLFNLTFYPILFKDPTRIGRAYIWGTIVLTIGIILVETLFFISPFFQTNLNDLAPKHFMAQFLTGFVGLVLFFGCSHFANYFATRHFEHYDA